MKYKQIISVLSGWIKPSILKFALLFHCISHKKEHAFCMKFVLANSLKKYNRMKLTVRKAYPI